MENIILSDKKLKLIDFGLSKQFSGLLSTPCGSKFYAAPEVFRGEPYDPIKADIWTVGVILFGLVSGYLPFDNKNSTKIQFPKYLSDKCKAFILSILQPNPSKRPSIGEIKEDSFYLSFFRKTKESPEKKVKYCSTLSLTEIRAGEKDLSEGKLTETAMKCFLLRNFSPVKSKVKRMISAKSVKCLKKVEEADKMIKEKKNLVTKKFKELSSSIRALRTTQSIDFAPLSCRTARKRVTVKKQIKAVKKNIKEIRAKRSKFKQKDG